MENNIENKIELKDKINSFYKEYKVKIILLICIFLFFNHNICLKD